MVLIKPLSANVKKKNPTRFWVEIKKNNLIKSITSHRVPFRWNWNLVTVLRSGKNPLWKDLPTTGSFLSEDRSKVTFSTSWRKLFFTCTRASQNQKEVISFCLWSLHVNLYFSHGVATLDVSRLSFPTMHIVEVSVHVSGRKPLAISDHALPVVSLMCALYFREGPYDR